MIYTFSFDEDFLKSFKDNLDAKQAYEIHSFIVSNFIVRDNFYLKINEKRKKFFGRNVNGGNGQILKDLMYRLGRKVKDFPQRNNNADFIFSNNHEDNIRNLTFKKILENSNDIESDLEKNCKPFWTYSNSCDDENNKKVLAEKLEKLILYSDEIYLIDRHIPRTICKAKLNNAAPEDKIFYSSYSNSLEFFNSIIKDKKSPNTFYCGITVGNYNTFKKKGLNIEKTLEEFFFKLKESKSKVKVVSGDVGYKNPQMYKRLIIGLINNELFTMFKTDKGLNILDEKNRINPDKRDFEVLRQEYALGIWEEWKLVKYIKPMIQFSLSA